MSRAVFQVAEHGGYMPAEIGFTQDNGVVKGLALKAKVSIIASAPNENATTIEEALTRPETEAQATVRALTAVPEAKTA